MSTVWYPQVRATLQVVFDGFGGDDTSPTVVQLIPQSMQACLNGYKEADTWELTFDAKALPFSPDFIRAIGVEIYAFDAGSVNPPAEAFATDENLLVAGLADNADISYGDDGRTFTCDGRDYTALLIDKQWNPEKKVTVNVLLSKWVQDTVDEAVGAKKHGGRTILVEYVGANAEPMVGQHGSVTKTKKNGKPVQPPKDGTGGTSVWDVIYLTVQREGLICFIRGFKLIITDPQTLTTQNAVASRRVAYGRNLQTLQVERKLGKEKVPQIIATSHSSKARGSIEARFPEKSDTTTTGIGTNKDEQVRVVIRGVEDVAALKKCAEAYYNSIARAEAKISFTTKSLTDMGDRSMLTLRAGDPVIIGFDPFTDALFHNMSREERYQSMIQQDYSKPVAALVADEYDRIEQFLRPFYTQSMTVNWDAKDGITLDVEAANFVVPTRDDHTANADPVGTATKQPKSTDPIE